MNQQIPIPDGHKHNLAEIVRAAVEGRLELASTVYKGTGLPVIVLVAKNDHGGGSFELVPFATLFNGDPIEQIHDPFSFKCNNCNNINDNNISITE